MGEPGISGRRRLSAATASVQLACAVGMLASLFVISLLCWNGSGSDSHGSPLFHLLTGASMLGAFFIVTEPVSGAKSPSARLLFGAGVGLLTYLIRTDRKSTRLNS